MTENSAGGAVESIANGNAVPYAVDPGSHELKLLVVSTDTPLTSCDLSQAHASATVDVKAGQRVEVFAYAPTENMDDIKLVTSTVAA